jgi:hypothetical protein
MGELFNIYIDLLSCNILKKYFYTICRTRVLEPHMQRTGDLRICLCALLCAGQGKGRLADYGYLTIFSIGSLVGGCLHFAKFVCLLCHSSASFPPPPPSYCIVCSVYSLIHVMVMYLLEKDLNNVSKETSHLAILKSKFI